MSRVTGCISSAGSATNAAPTPSTNYAFLLHLPASVAALKPNTSFSCLPQRQQEGSALSLNVEVTPSADSSSISVRVKGVEQWCGIAKEDGTWMVEDLAVALLSSSDSYLMISEIKSTADLKDALFNLRRTIGGVSAILNDMVTVCSSPGVTVSELQLQLLPGTQGSVLQAALHLFPPELQSAAQNPKLLRSVEARLLFADVAGYTIGAAASAVRVELNPVFGEVDTYDMKKEISGLAPGVVLLPRLVSSIQSLLR